MTSFPLAGRLPQLGRTGRLAGLGLLALVLTIPVSFVRFVIADRAAYHEIARAEVGYGWGGPVVLQGPVLHVPVERSWIEESTGPNGTVTKTPRRGAAPPLILLPGNLTVTGEIASMTRRRGIFDIPVYDAALKLDFDFGADRATLPLEAGETAFWDQARVLVFLPEGRNFKGEARLDAGSRALVLEPGTSFAERPGLQARIGDPSGLGTLALAITLGGAERLFFTPAGHLTAVSLHGTWPDPSFEGRFLPVTRETGAQGFAAEWLVPHLSRGVPQVFRGSEGIDELGAQGFGLSLFDPNSLYALTEKAAKHGILFIALSFLVLFLIEASRPAHPVHLFLAGMAQVVFFLLLLSLSEQIGFAAAYLVAAGATVLLLVWHGHAVLRLGRRNLPFAAALVLLYLALYGILNSSDHALLTGSILAFGAVAATMVATRNETWASRA